jgi:hypothetical protein
MKNIELNEQTVDWLIEHLRQELDENNPITYSETSKGIMQHLLEKLNQQK